MILIFLSWCQNQSKEGVSPLATVFFFPAGIHTSNIISNLSNEMFITFWVS